MLRWQAGMETNLGESGYRYEHYRLKQHNSLRQNFRFGLICNDVTHPLFLVNDSMSFNYPTTAIIPGYISLFTLSYELLHMCTRERSPIIGLC